MNKASKTQAIFDTTNILRYPRLDTMLMVEKTIKEADNYLTKTQLWNTLPKKVMYQTFCTIIDYLEYSNRIIIDKRDGKIIWVWNPEGVKELLSKPHLIVRSSASTID